ncbi:MAG: carbohydrate ABC transporter permease [Mycobacteriales bacterium]
MAVTTVTAAGATAGGRAVTTSDESRVPGENKAGWLLFTPFLVLYVVFLIGPAIYGVVMSFFHTTLIHTGLGSWAGGANYMEAFKSSDFWWSMWHTTYFTLMTTPPLVVVALIMAVLVERVRHFRWFFRLIFFAPYVVPSAAVGLIWGFLYAAQTGLFSTWVSQIGITPPNWLGDPSWALPSVALATIWWTVGFNFVLYLAGLQDIPRDLYEAAAVDGATPMQQVRSITIPLLGRTTLLVTILQILASLKIFDQVYLLTAGGPNFTSRPAIEYIYDIGFTDYRAGYAAAASMLFFVLILLVGAVFLVVSRRQQRGV